MRRSGAVDPVNGTDGVTGGGTRTVLFVTDNLGGGTGNHLLSMMKYWDGSRSRAGIISAVRPTVRSLPGDSTIEFLPERRWYDQYPVGQLRRLSQLRHRVIACSPDLLHTYFFWPIMYGRVLKLLGQVRTLVENREDEGFSWGRSEYALLRLTRSVPDRVICVSEAVRRIVLRREGLDPARVVVIHNGIEPVQRSLEKAEAVRGRLRIAKDDPVVGMIANFNRAVKGVTYFLDAIPVIVQALPSARFLLVGHGKEEEALRMKARALGIESRVLFAGYQRDVEGYYGVMDVSVLSSLSEGLSITLLESMSHGLPVVVTRVGGNSEVVVEGETGYLVPPKDVAAFAGQIVRLLRDPVLRVRMGESARRRVAQHFHIRDVARRYLDVYAEAAGKRPGYVTSPPQSL